MTERDGGPAVFIHVTLKDTCDHQWDGPGQPLFDGDGNETGHTATCSKCGADAFSWTMRNAD